MNLSDMAALVCLRLNKSDEASIAACKAFLRQRNEMVYNAALWRDTQVVESCVAQQMPGQNAWSPDLILPTGIARPVAIRKGSIGNGGLIRPTSMESAMTLQSGSFEAVGTPAEYAEIAPTGLPFLHNGVLSVFGAASDIGVQVVINGVVNGNKAKEVLTINGGTVFSASEWQSVSSVTKPVTTDSVQVANVSGSSVYYMQPTETRTQFARVRLFQVPEWGDGSAVSFLVLGKARLSGYEDDAAEPMIRGSDNCLIAYATGDMLERGRQYGKAQLKFQEGGAMLQQMISVDVAQSAGVMRLIPEVGVHAGSVDDLP